MNHIKMVAKDDTLTAAEKRDIQRASAKPICDFVTSRYNVGIEADIVDTYYYHVKANAKAVGIN